MNCGISGPLFIQNSSVSPHSLVNSKESVEFPPSRRLEAKTLACPPSVSVPEPMVTVSTGDTVRLGCVVRENPSARLKWVRSGVVIRNNSRNAEQGEAEVGSKEEVNGDGGDLPRADESVFRRHQVTY